MLTWKCKFCSGIVDFSWYWKCFYISGKLFCIELWICILMTTIFWFCCPIVLDENLKFCGCQLLCILWIIIWGLWCQKQVFQVGISNYIPQFTVGCNYLSLPEIPASGTKVLISPLCGILAAHPAKCICSRHYIYNPITWGSQLVVHTSCVEYQLVLSLQSFLCTCKQHTTLGVQLL